MKKPMIMGGLMGVMMLWMVHGAMTGSGVTGWALAVFVGAHLVVLALAGLAAVFAARLSPNLRLWMQRLHRPTASHIAVMFASAAIVMGTIHLSAHSLGGV